MKLVPHVMKILELQNHKFHLKIFIGSSELKKMNKIESNKKIYKILDYEIKNFIHSLQLLID